MRLLCTNGSGGGLVPKSRCARERQRAAGVRVEDAENGRARMQKRESRDKPSAWRRQNEAQCAQEMRCSGRREWAVHR